MGGVLVKAPETDSCPRTRRRVAISTFGRQLVSFEADLTDSEVLDLETAINWNASLLRVWIRRADGLMPETGLRAFFRRIARRAVNRIP